MPATAFGTLVRRLREVRSLSLRELGQLSGIDHAYIHRLETGEKEAPSDDVVSRLLRALKPNKRQESVLRFLNGRNVATELVDPLIVDDDEIAVEDFESAAQMSFRGKKPASAAEWRKAIEGIRVLREKIEGG
jgi:transcriptional regulator with XRE-family HTH domain